MVIEPAHPSDLEEILRIEEACFSAPWTRKMLEAELSGNQFAHFLCARQPGMHTRSGEIVGYLCFWVVFEELRIMNLAITVSARRQGLATGLVKAALEIGLAKGASRALLEVRASNNEALHLYERAGFRRVSIRSGYYSQPIEDAVLMEMDPIHFSTRSEVPGLGFEADGAHNVPNFQPGGAT